MCVCVTTSVVGSPNYRTRRHIGGKVSTHMLRLRCDAICTPIIMSSRKSSQAPVAFCPPIGCCMHTHVTSLCNASLAKRWRRRDPPHRCDYSLIIHTPFTPLNPSSTFFFLNFRFYMHTPTSDVTPLTPLYLLALYYRVGANSFFIIFTFAHTIYLSIILLIKSKETYFSLRKS